VAQLAEALRYKPEGCGLDSQWSEGLSRGCAADRLLGLGVRIPPGACMFVLCVVSTDWRTVKTKTQVRMEYRVQKNTKNWVIGIFHRFNPGPVAQGSTQPLTEMGTREISYGVKTAGAWG
jgi:hypothetical protein